MVFIVIHVSNCELQVNKFERWFSYPVRSRNLCSNVHILIPVKLVHNTGKCFLYQSMFNKSRRKIIALILSLVHFQRGKFSNKHFRSPTLFFQIGMHLLYLFRDCTLWCIQVKVAIYEATLYMKYCIIFSSCCFCSCTWLISRSIFG